MSRILTHVLSVQKPVLTSRTRFECLQSQEFCFRPVDCHATSWHVICPHVARARVSVALSALRQVSAKNIWCS